MESAICLPYTPLPTAPLRLSSRAIGVRASRVHLSLSHAPLCLSHCSMRHPAEHASRGVNCMLENARFSVPSKNEGSDNNMMRGMRGISLVMACVLGVFNFSSKMNPKSITAYAYPFRWNEPAPTSIQNTNRPMSGPMPGSAESAVDSLLNMIKHSDSQHQTLSKPQIKVNPPPAELKPLKLYAVGLTKSGKLDEAVEILQKQYERLEEKSESQQYLDMAWIEILILQGKYKEALQRLDDRIDASIPDPKVNDDEKIKELQEDPVRPKIFLYKGILHTMLGKKEAAKWWEAFTNTVA